ncbi:IclR family transcriptional regulator [Amycolatopsis jejuensis]|uniref:IclR family transcriptional regulator n=1 Tax=Amycolatopsis jejuensis TaxID=330084 RepID=UPI00068F4D15|nr:IclR family transcriptional regulator [Amycolatopsis jejuensis]
MTAVVPLPNNAETLLTKVRLIFDTFEGEQQQLTLSDIARRSSLAKSTVYRLVAELVEHGYLDRAGTAYQLGTRLFALGQRVPAHEELRQTALPYMATLFKAVRAPVFLGVLGHHEVLYVEKLIGTRDAHSAHPIRHRAPLHATASGKIFLAYARPSPLESLRQSDLRRFTAQTIDSFATLRDTVTEVRRAGYAVMREEYTDGYGAVAVPLLTAARELAGALSVLPHMSRMSVSRIVPPLQITARRLMARYESRQASR